MYITPVNANGHYIHTSREDYTPKPSNRKIKQIWLVWSWVTRYLPLFLVYAHINWSLGTGTTVNFFQTLLECLKKIIIAISLTKPLKLVGQLLSEEFNELPKMPPRNPDCWFFRSKGNHSGPVYHTDAIHTHQLHSPQFSLFKRQSSHRVGQVNQNCHTVDLLSAKKEYQIYWKYTFNLFLPSSTHNPFPNGRDVSKDFGTGQWVFFKFMSSTPFQKCVLPCWFYVLWSCGRIGAAHQDLASSSIF